MNHQLRENNSHQNEVHQLVPKILHPVVANAHYQSLHNHADTTVLRNPQQHANIHLNQPLPIVVILVLLKKKQTENSVKANHLLLANVLKILKTAALDRFQNHHHYTQDHGLVLSQHLQYHLKIKQEIPDLHLLKLRIEMINTEIE
jgi:hypothetical protein